MFCRGSLPEVLLSVRRASPLSALLVLSSILVVPSRNTAKCPGRVSAKGNGDFMLYSNKFYSFIYFFTRLVAFIVEEGKSSLRALLGDKLVELLPHQLRHLFPLPREMMGSGRGHYKQSCSLHV